MPSLPTSTADIAGSELRVCDTVGALMEFWGFKRPMGRIWTLLYLSPAPLAAADIGERLSMSAGGVSMALGDLLKWGAVKRTWRPGERRDFYEAETSVWKMVSRVFRERELALVREAAAAFAAAEAVLARAAKAAPKEEQRRLAFARQRIAALHGLARVGEGLLNAIVSGGRVDTRPLRELDEGADD